MITGRYALNQGTPKAILYFFPAVSRSYPLRFAPCLRSTLAFMAAVRLPQPRHCAPHTFRYNSATATF